MRIQQGFENKKESPPCVFTSSALGRKENFVPDSMSSQKAITPMLRNYWIFVDQQIIAVLPDAHSYILSRFNPMSCTQREGRNDAVLSPASAAFMFPMSLVLNPCRRYLFG
jgi:hypothetical protein